jgi:predicted ATP-grasp superfamily ATP-dependent carboligase
MSHLLIVDLPGGNDTDILTTALADGHRFSFLTADPGHYRAQREVAALLGQGKAVIDAEGFALPVLLPRLRALHRADPFDAVLCLQDLRIVEAADIARALGLRHLNPETARAARNKAEVRRRLSAAGMPQPAFTEVRGPAELIAAAKSMEPPLLVKPIDGFGSQNIFALRRAEDLAALRLAPQIIADGPGHYGLGVAAGGAMLVERFLEGRLLACDTLSVDGRHRLLGVNEKLLFPPPSFAIRGGCFTTNCGQFSEIETYAFRLLDALGFDQGAAHIEIMLTAERPALIEINPRLVGARTARLLSAALGRFGARGPDCAACRGAPAATDHHPHPRGDTLACRTSRWRAARDRPAAKHRAGLCWGHAVRAGGRCRLPALRQCRPAGLRDHPRHRPRLGRNAGGRDCRRRPRADGLPRASLMTCRQSWQLPRGGPDHAPLRRPLSDMRQKRRAACAV